jgi:hypothetical protein
MCSSPKSRGSVRESRLQGVFEDMDQVLARVLLLKPMPLKRDAANLKALQLSELK